MKQQSCSDSYISTYYQRVDLYIHYMVARRWLYGVATASETSIVIALSYIEIWEGGGFVQMMFVVYVQNINT